MKMYQVDAFTKELFRGNPAAVIIGKEWPNADLMQKIALENNLSETAFVKIIDSENYEIRWFTPTVEVDFCGHATLASAFVLFKDFTEKKTLNFHVRNLGLFVVHQDEDGKIRMDFAITSKADDQYDCVSRYFAPVAGIDEDPVTGSIHTAIAPLWAEKLAKNNIVAYQASSRGGVLYCNVLNQERIEISGYGKLYMQAEIFP
ncbi:PhzF family phenazine biosynthesis protein [Acinetobacter baumannii]|nr:PhzF family phenazine biosynthesis protein [Acinetobacter baumannii]